MMPKSLPHQTLAKLFSENGSFTSVFCCLLFKDQSLNKQHSTEIPKLCQVFFCVVFLQHVTTLTTGLSGEVRTPDLLLPKQAFYQAELHSEKQNPETFWASGFVHFINNCKLCTNSYPNYP
jgi:hypothetical protein